METENFAALDLQKEYYATLRAARIAGTAFLLLSVAWSGMQYAGVADAAKIFVGDTSQVFALSCLAPLSAVLYLWVAGRSLSRVILATTTGVVGCLLIGFLVQLAHNDRFQTLIIRYFN